MSLAIRDKCLSLDELYIGLPQELLDPASPDEEPSIFGKPLRRYQYKCQAYCKEADDWVEMMQTSSEARAVAIDGQLLWDGYLLLGSGPCPPNIVSHPACHYKTIIECEFKRGALVGLWDKSPECQKLAEWVDSDACPKYPKDPYGDDRRLFQNWSNGLNGLFGALFHGVYHSTR